MFTKKFMNKIKKTDIFICGLQEPQHASFVVSNLVYKLTNS